MIADSHVCAGIIAGLGVLLLIGYWKVYAEYKAMPKESAQTIVLRGVESASSRKAMAWIVSLVATVGSFVAAVALLVIVNNILALSIVAVFTLSALLWPIAILKKLRAAKPIPTLPNDTDSDDGITPKNDIVFISYVPTIPASTSPPRDYALWAVLLTAFLSVLMLITAILGGQDSGFETHRDWLSVLLVVVCFHHIVMNGFVWTIIDS